jgi:hypothetical protein
MAEVCHSVAVEIYEDRSNLLNGPRAGWVQHDAALDEQVATVSAAGAQPPLVESKQIRV